MRPAIAPAPEFASWNAMWHIVRPDAVFLARCGRVIPAKAARRKTAPSEVFLCLTCRRDAE